MSHQVNKVTEEVKAQAFNTENTVQTIEQVSQMIKQIVQATERQEESNQQIVQATADISKASQAIRLDTARQVTSIERTQAAVSEVEKVAHGNDRIAQQTLESAQAVAEFGEELREMVQEFQLSAVHLPQRKKYINQLRSPGAISQAPAIKTARFSRVLNDE